MVATSHFSANANDRIQFSGYGSIVGGKVLSGQVDPSGEKEFQVDFYDYAFYTTEFDFEQESMVAVQMRADVVDNLSATVQLVAKGADGWSPDVDWAYLSYQVGQNGTLMAGRRMLPMYYFSEYMEVGYAYPWIRPPANLYWWEITQFNGLTYSHSFNLADWTLNASVFGGRETQRDIKSHDFWRNRGGYYFPPEGTYISGTADVSWSKILGTNLALSNDWIDLRASYFRTHYNTTSDIFFTDELDLNNDGVVDKVIERFFKPDGSRYISGDWPLTDFDLDFYGLGGSLAFQYLTLLFDYNYVVYDDGYGSEFPTFYVSLVYNHDVWQPYVGLSSAKLKLTKDWQGFGIGEAEEHQILTLGVRYNLGSNAAIKLEYNDFSDKGDRSPWFDFSYHNDASLLSVGVDFVF
jgi:hypothetical protein